jgi:mannitol/fructose-specific phosphotransferase system IIA component
MSMVKLLIHVPAPLKAKLDALREQGYTASGYIRALLERELAEPSANKKGR